MPFLPYKLLAQPQNAALPELCLLGKNTTFNDWSKWLWAKSHSRIYFKLFFNQILDTKFGPVKVRALKTPKHVSIHMPPHPRQAQHRKERKVNDIYFKVVMPTQEKIEIRCRKDKLSRPCKQNQSRTFVNRPCISQPKARAAHAG